MKEPKEERNKELVTSKDKLQDKDQKEQRKEKKNKKKTKKKKLKQRLTKQAEERRKLAGRTRARFLEVFN